MSARNAADRLLATESDWIELCGCCGLRVRVTGDIIECAAHHDKEWCARLSLDRFLEFLQIPERSTGGDTVQYPEGTDLLWMAHYRKDPDIGLMDGTACKLSGTLEEAAAEAQRIAVRDGLILQCLRRRY